MPILSFFKQRSVHSDPPPPTAVVTAPPPSAAARQEKERHWYNSIGGVGRGSRGGGGGGGGEKGISSAEYFASVGNSPTGKKGRDRDREGSVNGGSENGDSAGGGKEPRLKKSTPSMRSGKGGSGRDREGSFGDSPSRSSSVRRPSNPQLLSPPALYLPTPTDTSLYRSKTPTRNPSNLNIEVLSAHASSPTGTGQSAVEGLGGGFSFISRSELQTSPVRLGLSNGNGNHVQSSDITSPGSPSRSRSAPHHQQQQIEAAEVVTKSLATRLQELAVANEDGLLNDEEYRVLRENLFSRFENVETGVGEQAVRVIGGSQADLGEYERPSSPPFPSRDGSLLSAPRLRPSNQSTRSSVKAVTSLFRKSSTRPSGPLESNWEDVLSDSDGRPSSMFSGNTKDSQSILRGASGGSLYNGGGSVKGGRVRPKGGLPSSFSDPSVYGLSLGGGGGGSSSFVGSPPPVRARSVKSSAMRPETSTSASARSLRFGDRERERGASDGPSSLKPSSSSIFSASTDVSRASTSARSHAQSHYSHSHGPLYSYSASARRRGKLNTLSSPDFFDGADGMEEPTADEIRNEIADIESECERLIESFRGMELEVVKRYRPNIVHEIAENGDDGGRGGRGKGTTTTKGLGEFGSGLTIGSDWRGSVIGRSNSPTPSHSTITRSNFLLRKRSHPGLPKEFSPTTNGGDTKSKRDSRKLLSPSSASTTDPNSLFWLPSLVLQQVEAEGASDNESVKAMKAELEGITKKRRTVEERYEKRLEWLRAKLRGALIKQKLPK